MQNSKKKGLLKRILNKITGQIEDRTITHFTFKEKEFKITRMINDDGKIYFMGTSEDGENVTALFFDPETDLGKVYE